VIARFKIELVAVQNSTALAAIRQCLALTHCVLWNKQWFVQIQLIKIKIKKLTMLFYINQHETLLTTSGEIYLISVITTPHDLQYSPISSLRKMLCSQQDEGLPLASSVSKFPICR